MSQLLKSYISERQFRDKCGDDYSNVKDISAGVLLGSVLYLLYTADICKCDGVTTATSADNTAVLDTGVSIEGATEALQLAVEYVTRWTKISAHQAARNSYQFH